MNPSDRDLLAKTLQAEAGNQGLGGMLAAGSVIMNRTQTPGYGSGLRGVILKPGQFSAWNSLTGYAGGEQGQDMLNMRPSAAAYQAADKLLTGDYQDQTGGATHYYNPSISNPKWGQKRAGGDWQRIGDHIFGFADAGRGKRSPQATTGTQGAAPMMQQEQKPRGLLEGFGIQKMEEGAEGETGQRFYNRDSFKDTAAVLAQGFGRMGIMGMEEIADNIANQRTENKARNKTVEFLRKSGRTDLADMVDQGLIGAKDAASAMMGGETPAAFRALEYQAEAAGLAKGTPEYQEFMLSGGGAPATYRALEMQAEAAGFEKGTPEFKEFMATRGAGLQAGAKQTATNLAQIETGAAAAAAGKSGELTMERGFKAYDDAVKAGNALSTMDEAIAALDSGAKSGIVYNMLPNVTEASASLSNAMNRMGLDVISSVTFGALSEAEMNLAMETAVPRGLAPDELRSWLVKKRDAQAKAREALMSAARYLTQPGNTLSGWMEEQANAPAAAPTPTGGGAARLKFNPDTGEFE